MYLHAFTFILRDLKNKVIHPSLYIWANMVDKMSYAHQYKKGVPKSTPEPKREEVTRG
jgi:hypothetical protein